MSKAIVSRREVSTGGCTSFAAHKDGSSVYFGTPAGEVLVYDVDCTDSVKAVSIHPGGVVAMQMRNVLVSAGADGSVYRSDMSADGSDIGEFELIQTFGAAKIGGMTCSFQSRRVYVSYDECHVAELNMGSTNSDVVAAITTKQNIQNLMVDPLGMHLAVVQSDQTVCLYDVSSRLALWTYPLGVAGSALCWLVLGDYCFLSQEGGIGLFSVKGAIVRKYRCDGLGTVLEIANSPDGVYVAAQGSTGQQAVWDSVNAKVVQQTTVSSSSPPVGMLWNYLTPSLTVALKSGLVYKVDVSAYQHYNNSSNSEDSGATVQQAQQSSRRGRVEDDEEVFVKRAKTKFDEQDEEEEPRSDGEDNVMLGAGSIDLETVAQLVQDAVKQYTSKDKTVPAMPFSSTPPGPQRYLAWTDVGSVLSSNGSLLVHFNEGNRKTSVKDPIQSSFADLNKNFLVLGSRRVKGKKTSVPAAVRLLRTANQASEVWGVEFGLEEDVSLLALGGACVAVATSNNFLRIFSVCGMERAVLSIPGVPIGLTAKNHSVCVFYATTDRATYVQTYFVDATTIRLTTTCSAPCSPSHHLVWAELTSSGVLITMDSSGTLRALMEHMGNAWVVLHTQAANEPRIWPVALKSSLLVYVPLHTGRAYPDVRAERPVTKALQLKLPLLCVSTSAEPSRTDAAYASAVRDRLFIQEQRHITKNTAIPVQKDTNVAYTVIALSAVQDNNLMKALEAVMFIEDVALLEKCLEKAKEIQNAEPFVVRLNAIIKSRSAQPTESIRNPISTNVDSTPNIDPNDPFANAKSKKLLLK